MSVAQFVLFLKSGWTLLPFFFLLITVVVFFHPLWDSFSQEALFARMRRGLTTCAHSCPPRPHLRAMPTPNPLRQLSRGIGSCLNELSQHLLSTSNNTWHLLRCSQITNRFDRAAFNLSLQRPSEASRTMNPILALQQRSGT